MRDKNQYVFTKFKKDERHNKNHEERKARRRQDPDRKDQMEHEEEASLETMIEGGTETMRSTANQEAGSGRITGSKYIQ